MRRESPRRERGGRRPGRPYPPGLTGGESPCDASQWLRIHAKINRMANQPQNPPVPTPPARERLTLDLSHHVSSLLDHISAVTGSPRSQIALQALLESLPGLVERADAIKRRAGELVQAKGGKK